MTKTMIRARKAYLNDKRYFSAWRRPARKWRTPGRLDLVTRLASALIGMTPNEMARKINDAAISAIVGGQQA